MYYRYYPAICFNYIVLELSFYLLLQNFIIKLGENLITICSASNKSIYNLHAPFVWIFSHKKDVLLHFFITKCLLSN